MKKWVGMLTATVALAIAGCATEEATKAGGGAGGKVLDAAALQKVFKSGGGQCAWTSNGTKGEDNYFSTVSKAKGEADRYIGSGSQQGKWEIKGNQFCLDFGKNECSTFEEVGKGTYKATYGGKTFQMKC